MLRTRTGHEFLHGSLHLLSHAEHVAHSRECVGQRFGRAFAQQRAHEACIQRLQRLAVGDFPR
jgi:hypothetical protein